MSQTFVEFKNQVCVITGAGSPNGIGFSAAKILGGLGGRIAIISTTDRIFQRAMELQEAGIVARGYVADLMDREAAKRLIHSIVSDFDSIEVLVNNAGMTQVGQQEDFADFLSMTYESWDITINRNLNTCFNVTKEVLPYMIKNKYGRIVNVSSVTGPIVSNPGEAAYSAAKAAILGMSRSIAIEAGKYNITINCVLPGWIASGSQTESEAAGGIHTPIGRGGTPEEVANAIVFLASKEASYITGESVIVDGGNTIQEYKGPTELYY